MKDKRAAFIAEVMKQNEANWHTVVGSVGSKEKAEAEKRKYWSEYWRKRSGIAAGCVTW